MTRQCTSLFVLLCFVTAVPASAQAAAATKAERIDQLLARYQEYGYFNGAILVADHGKVISPHTSLSPSWWLFCL